eukprot:COSAG01_NODE_3753_length_5730_cov_2.551057_1_plen_45_part_10
MAAAPKGVIAVGSPCPDMTVPVQSGESVTLSELWSKGEGGLILFF